ncbi:hypothetical protein KFE25_003577 [Diacronema lutheri]|uniref:Uncharacterized protein n=1 Tax=Diacronema lutheri TaxID=2081491 RepID=A0A8J5X471_DIALT|nr:hypothetical protein KFE25_003577 [Diacronema lutheri]
MPHRVLLVRQPHAIPRHGAAVFALARRRATTFASRLGPHRGAKACEMPTLVACALAAAARAGRNDVWRTTPPGSDTLSATDAAATPLDGAWRSPPRPPMPRVPSASALSDGAARGSPPAVAEREGAPACGACSRALKRSPPCTNLLALDDV